MDTVYTVHRDRLKDSNDISLGQEGKYADIGGAAGMVGDLSIGGGVGGAWNRGDDGGEDVGGYGIGSADGDVGVGELGSN